MSVGRTSLPQDGEHHTLATVRRSCAARRALSQATLLWSLAGMTNIALSSIFHTHTHTHDLWQNCVALRVFASFAVQYGTVQHVTALSGQQC